MFESQFEKLLKTLKKRDTDIERLTVLLERCVPHLIADCRDGQLIAEIITEIAEELGDDR